MVEWMRAFGSCFESHYISETVPVQHTTLPSIITQSRMSSGARGIWDHSVQPPICGKASWLDLHCASFPFAKGVGTSGPGCFAAKVSSLPSQWACIKSGHWFSITLEKLHNIRFWHWCAAIAHVYNPNTQAQRFTAVFVGRASKASCFGTSAEKVPLQISSGKQA